MLYKYQIRTPEGELKNGSIEASSNEAALRSLQKQNFVIVSLESVEDAKPWYQISLSVFERVKTRDVVILSRQLATLFEAKVPVVDALKVLSSEASSDVLKRNLSEVLDDIQGGSSISEALNKHPKVFSKFYVSMVRSGEESGKLGEVLTFLADYLERNYTLTTKARNAMIYPAFIVITFIIVMLIMLTVIMPRISSLIFESGQDVPFYTRVIIGIGDFIRQFGFIILILLAAGIAILWRYYNTKSGKMTISHIQLSVPVIGQLYKKLYLARIADNLETLLSSGVSIVRALEITADIVGNEVYAAILNDSINSVKAGNSISESFSKYEEMPSLMSQSIRIGEETGKLDFILSTLAKFYRREVESVIDNLITLIEPIMIVVLGLGVGIMVASVLIPIYNISSSF